MDDWRLVALAYPRNTEEGLESKSATGTKNHSHEWTVIASLTLADFRLELALSAREPHIL